VALATVAANRNDGDPIWLLLVGGPGNLKTELLQTLGKLPEVHPVGNITEAGLLSGTSSSEKDRDATGGLLRQVGDFGILVAKDFGSTLSMRRDKRREVLGALREIYDGEWTRTLGTDGGKTLHWKGKVGLLGGVTSVIDTAHSVMASMGERFTLFRMPELDEEEQARAALAHAATGCEIRQELAGAVAEFFANLPEQTPSCPSPEQEARLIQLASLLAKCRSSVIRDGWRREIELIEAPEAPTRIAIVLGLLRGGLEVIGCEEGEVWKILQKVALDCMPVVRRALLDQMATDPEVRWTVTDLREGVGYPETTTRRHLEDLEAHGVVVRHGDLPPVDLWQLTEWTRSRLAALKEPFGAPPGGAAGPEPEDAASADNATEASPGPVARGVPEKSPAPVSIPEKSPPTLLSIKAQGDISETQANAGHATNRER
jgi:DNA-binding transcriptional ArsR family regulator